MSDSLKGRVFVLFAATGDLGRALTRILSENGARLLLTARREDGLKKLAESAGDARHMIVDAADFDATTQAFARARSEFDQVDGAVNCAGSVLIKPAHTTTLEEYRETISRNLDTAFAVTRAGAKAMMKSGGSIVLLTSAAAQTGIPSHEAIAAAKGGVIGLTRSAAATYGPRGVRVNAVAPGLVESSLTEAIVGDEKMAKASRDMHALGRLGKPDDIARAVAWLLDPDQGWVTGQVLGVDGGLAWQRVRARI